MTRFIGRRIPLPSRFHPHYITGLSSAPNHPPSPRFAPVLRTGFCIPWSGTPGSSDEVSARPPNPNVRFVRTTGSEMKKGNMHVSFHVPFSFFRFYTVLPPRFLLLSFCIHKTRRPKAPGIYTTRSRPDRLKSRNFVSPFHRHSPPS